MKAKLFSYKALGVVLFIVIMAVFLGGGIYLEVTGEIPSPAGFAFGMLGGMWPAIFVMAWLWKKGQKTS